MASEEIFEQGEQQTSKKMASEEMKLMELDHGDFGPVAPEVMGGPRWGQCINLTDEILIVYGPNSPKDPSHYGNSMYFLPPGCTTPDNWDCDGFYVPNDRVAKQRFSKKQGPLAIKFWDLRHFTVAKSAPDEYKCYDNNGAFKQGEINWAVPNLSYAEVVRRCKS